MTLDPGYFRDQYAASADPWGLAERWYEAYLDFYRRLHAPAARLERKLRPGEVVIFDNRRLLEEGMPAAPRFTSYLGACATRPADRGVYEQMLDDM